MRLPLVLRGFCGAIAQLGERNTGSVEVVGSIPSGSTIQSKTYPAHPRVLREYFLQPNASGLHELLKVVLLTMQTLKLCLAQHGLMGHLCSGLTLLFQRHFK